MKQLIKNLVFLTACMLAVVSCTDEKEINVKEGVAVDAKLSVGATSFEKIETKVADEYIADLYVMIFDESGNLVTHAYYSGRTGLEGDISIKTTSGKRYIYGVANLTSANLTISQSTLAAISTLSQLKQLMMTLNSSTIGNADGKYLMSGFWCVDATSETAEKCIINTNGGVTSTDGTSTGSLKFKRLQSRITFKVTYGGNASKFTITEVNIKNIPNNSKLSEDGTGTVSSGYFNVDKLATNAGNTSFTFYMLENKQTAKGTLTKYTDREERSNGNWIYAPDNATYVEIKGHYVGTADRYVDGKKTIKPSSVDADVVYYVHLGNVDSDKNVNLDDFNSYRNKDYTYNISITGVNSLVSEVEVSGDEYSRGDGDVYYADGNTVLTFDAHYAQVVLPFTYEQLGVAGIDFKILVKSNKTSGFEEKDLGWLTFVENPSNETKAVSYPGSTSTDLLTASQFLKKLEAFRDDSKNAGKTIYFTCYVNEYYPIGTDTGWKDYVNQSDRYAQIICHTKSGNGSNLIDAAYVIRQHPILSFYNLSNVNTAWGIEWENETTNIQSVDNQNIEIGLPYGTPNKTSDNSADDGYSNMSTEIGSSQRWYSDNISPSSKLKYRDYQTKLKTAFAACMQRNRDENGDGVISADEIKWYLPALNQYLDMSIGMNILPQDVQLYSNSDYKTSFNINGVSYWMNKHFISNTSKSIFWAEESGSYCAWGKSWENYITKGTSASGSARQFRCIRNLGSVSASTSFVSYSASASVMDLSNVNPQALRSEKLSMGELIKHTERDVYSRPYTKFRIAKKLASGSVGWETQNTQADTYGTSVCSSYSEESNDVGTWRLPNMRELMLMVRYGGFTNSIMCRTYFSFYGGTIVSQDGTTREGYAYDGNFRLLNPGNSKWAVRCVKDE